METYIKELTGAHLYVGSAEIGAGEAAELVRPMADFVSRKMHILVVEPLPNGDVLVQGRSPKGKHGWAVVPRKEAIICMGVANALFAKGARLPRWVRYAIDAPSWPVVVYWSEKSAQ